MLIAARRGFAAHGALCTDVPEPYRLVEVDFGAVRLTGVYMPNMLKKVPYWQALVDAFAARVDDETLAIGDFNTCRAYRRRARRDRRDCAFHGPRRGDWVPRSVAASLSRRARILVVQPPRQRLPHRSCIPVARSCRAGRGGAVSRTRSVWLDCRIIRCCCWNCRHGDAAGTSSQDPSPKGLPSPWGGGRG